MAYLPPHGPSHDGRTDEKPVIHMGDKISAMSGRAVMSTQTEEILLTAHILKEK